MGLGLVRPELTELKPRITVIGVGGAGGNAVDNMIQSGLQGVDFVVANTDAQALALNPAENRIQLGLKITQGLGAGSRPEIGKAAAEETMEQVESALEGAHMCFITAGMGGGTGTGAAPVIARVARERGILTVGVVTKPFSFEGQRRMRAADEGIAELQKHVDTLIIIPNQNLFLIANANTTFKEAFAMADQVLHQGVRGITDLMVMPGLINLDFADIRTVMSEMGKAMMGTGEAEGDNRAIEAAEKAIANPLLDEVSMRGARGVIINITGGDDLRLMELDEAANHIREMVDPEANIIVGSAFNPDLDGRMRVSVVATGIDARAAEEAPAPAPSARFGGFSATPIGGSLGGATAARGWSAASASADKVETGAPLNEAEQASENDEAASVDLSADDELSLDEASIVAPLDVVDPMMPIAAPPAPTEVPVQQSFIDEPRPVDIPEVPTAAVPEQSGEAERSLSLFERMMNISLGAPKAQAESAPSAQPQADQGDAKRQGGKTSGDGIEIPRFFRRQVND